MPPLQDNGCVFLPTDALRAQSEAAVSKAQMSYAISTGLSRDVCAVVARPRQRTRSILIRRASSEEQQGKSGKKRVRFHASAMLWYAAEEGNTSEMARLLEASLRSSSSSSSSEEETAARVYNVAMDYNMHNHEGVTLLHLTCFLGDAASTRMLLKLGAHPNKPDKEGWTALHVAAARGHVKLVPLLLQAGASAPLNTQPGAIGVGNVTKDKKILRLVMKANRTESAEL